jgi:hypothetical protein
MMSLVGQNIGRCQPNGGYPIFVAIGDSAFYRCVETRRFNHLLSLRESAKQLMKQSRKCKAFGIKSLEL